MSNIESRSIHPRVVNSRTMFGKVNTAKPRRTKLSDDKIARMQKHMKAHPNDAMTAAYMSKVGAK